MKRRHIAFLLEQAYGHILPTLGVAAELVRRGSDVSFGVTEEFAPIVRRVNARAVILCPMETRADLCSMTALPEGGHDYALSEEQQQRFASHIRDRTQASLAQLEERYRGDRPDVVVHDDCLDLAGRTFADKWGIKRVRFHPLPVYREARPAFGDDRLVLVSVPKFFVEDADSFDERFKFIGFIPEGRREVAERWKRSGHGKPTILVSPTTGLMAQKDFCRVVAKALGDLDYEIVLSIPGDFDPLCVIDPKDLGRLPDNFRLNRYSSHLEILEDACLFVGQGGPGSTLEALYSGVPALLVPPTQAHDITAVRLARLGLGTRMSIAEASPERLRAEALALIEDEATGVRVKAAQRAMREDRGVEVAADLLS